MTQIKLHVEDAGAGPAILLLHAFPVDGRMWAGQVRDLAADYRLVVPDMPGFGRSPRPNGNPSLDDWARELVGVCRTRGIDQAVVVGCSMGGYVAFAMLRTQRDFVAALGLVDTRAAADTQDTRRTRYEMVERARHEGIEFLQSTDPPLSLETLRGRPEIVETVRTMSADATPVGVMAAQRAMASRKDSRTILADIRVPVAVIYGEDDSIVPRSEALAMANSIPGATFVAIARAGHLSPMEQPLVVSAALRELAIRAFPTSKTS